ncbi:MAG: class I SAM-dependent methyltransferase [Kiritimatiellia bacterium]
MDKYGRKISFFDFYNGVVALDQTAYGVEQRKNIGQLSTYLDKHSRVLDIGCGFGIPSFELQKSFKVSACDVPTLDGRRNKFVELVMEERGIDFGWIEEGVLPFEDGSFDGILLYAVIEHVRDKVKLLKECHRVLKPGGHVFSYRMVNQCAFAEKLATLMGIVTHGDDVVTAQILKDSFGAASLDICGMGYHGWLPENKLPVWPIYWANKILCKIPLVNRYSHDFWVIAKKP